MADNSEKRVELKDFAVIAPLLGTALAITYEVGSFVPLGHAAFGLFSLSEHLLWALAALPVVLAMFGFVALLYVFFDAQRFRQAMRPQRSDAGRRRKRILKWGLFLTAAMCVFALTTGWMERSALWIAIGISALLVMAVPSPPAVNTKSQRRQQSTFGIVLMMFLLAGAIGFDLTRATLSSGCVSEFTSKEATKSATLVRSGERGALLYDRARNLLTFEKWDDLKSISWSRRSPLEQFFFFPFPLATRPACKVGHDLRSISVRVTFFWPLISARKAGSAACVRDYSVLVS